MDSERQPLISNTEAHGPIYTENAVRRNSRNSLRGSRESLVSYDPVFYRNLDHPTSSKVALIHLLKVIIDSNFLAMPLAFKNAGMYVGLIGSIAVGLICTYCVHILLRCSHELCRRQRVPSMEYSEVAYNAFATGPLNIRSYSSWAKNTISFFLCVTQLGNCIVYILFVAVNLRSVISHYYSFTTDIRWYILMLAMPMTPLNFLKNLKYLAPVSFTATVLTLTGIGFTFYYIFQDLPEPSTMPSFSSWSQLPLYFGTTIFSFETISLALPLENSMRKPKDLIKPLGVLNIGMAISVSMYIAIGFFGYLKYGENVKESVTLNLDQNAVLAHAVRATLAIGVFLTYSLVFYIPMQVIQPWFQRLFSERNRNLGDAILRISLTILTFSLAIAIPNLGAIISLIGVLATSAIMFIFPPTIDILTFGFNGMGRMYWKLWKNILIIMFGLLALVFGTYQNILDLISGETC